MKISIKENNKLLLSGLIGGICYLLHDLCGFLDPSYSHLSQAVSDLTAIGSPVRGICEPFTIAYGVLSIVCSVIVVNRITKQKDKMLWLACVTWLFMNAVSMIGYSLFPLGMGKDLGHIVVTVMVVVSSIVSLILFIISGYKDNKKKQMGLVASIALLTMCLGAILTNIAPASIFGIVERFSTYSAVIFTAYLGIWTKNN